jgi:hypothetical protein
MRYRLRTLLIGLALGPPVMAIGYLCWHPPRHFDSFELLVTALAAALAAMALAGCLVVFWHWRQIHLMADDQRPGRDLSATPLCRESGNEGP